MVRVRSFCICLAFSISIAGAAQTLDSQGAVKAAVLAKYHVTQPTADRTDIVTPGDVMTLLKSGLVTYAGGRTGLVSYHEGKLNAGGMTKFSTFSAMGSNADGHFHVFVSGEKLWLIDVNVKDDGLYLEFMSDPINDVRYIGGIKFPADKKQPFPGVDVMLPLVAQVIAAAPVPGAAEPPPAPVAAAPPPPPLAPPPPPPDEAAAPPPTISLGEAEADVLAGFGQPVRVVKLGTKKIDYFKDMKVTFVGGKVTDVQ